MRIGNTFYVFEGREVNLRYLEALANLSAQPVEATQVIEMEISVRDDKGRFTERRTMEDVVIKPKRFFSRRS